MVVEISRSTDRDLEEADALSHLGLRLDGRMPRPHPICSGDVFVQEERLQVAEVFFAEISCLVEHLDWKLDMKMFVFGTHSSRF